jgi:hypothetical protein
MSLSWVFEVANAEASAELFSPKFRPPKLGRPEEAVAEAEALAPPKLLLKASELAFAMAPALDSALLFAFAFAFEFAFAFAFAMAFDPGRRKSLVMFFSLFVFFFFFFFFFI